MAKLAADPVSRYKELSAALSAPPPRSQLSPDALAAVIASHPSDEETALAHHVATHTTLMLADAEPLVHLAVKGKTDSAAKANAVSEASAAATGGSADIELSDPVMLSPLLRLIFGLLLFAALGVCINRVAALGKGTNPPESAVITLAVLGGLSLVGLLVLVMGYKNVTIKGSGPSAGGSSKT